MSTHPADARTKVVGPAFGRIRKTLATLVSAALAGAPGLPALAANHPNSSISQVNVVNLVANVDWDYDGEAPDQVGTPKAGAAPAKLTKTYVAAILREFARTQFLLSEGHHRIGKIYVYKNARFGDNVDIRLINKDGRSNAMPASWFQNNGSAFNFFSLGGRAEDLFQMGRVIAHENVHYMYGLYDEYRELGRAPNPSSPLLPADQDFAKATLMNTQNRFTRLSLPSDYVAGNPGDQNQTAQARMHATAPDLTGGSAWDVLVRDPALDPNATTKKRRVLFDAFKGRAVPQTEASLTKYVKALCNDRESSRYAGYACGDPGPSETYTRIQVVPAADRITTRAAYDSLLWSAAGGTDTADALDGAVGSAFENFQVVWADTPAVPTSGGAARGAVTRMVLMLDTSMKLTNIKLAVTAAEGVIQNAAETDFLGIALGDGSSAPLAPLTQATASGKAALLAALAAYVPAVGTLNLTTAYNAVLPVLQSGTLDGDANQLTLITYPSTAIQASLAETARAQRVPINAMTLHSYVEEPTRSLIVQSGGHNANDQIPIEFLSQRSGGHAVTGRSAVEAVSKMSLMAHEAKGDNLAQVVDDSFQFTRAESHAKSFSLTARDKGIVEVTWEFDPQDAGTLAFSLTSPSGRVITQRSADSDPAGGHVSIDIDNTAGDQAGKWTATVQASAATHEEVDLEVLSPTDLNLTVQISGPDRGLAPVITAMLAGEKPVSHADVVAQVFDAKTGALVKDGLVLLDDGVGEDLRADDGTYTLDLSKLLPAGDYIVKVSASTGATSMFEDGNLIFASLPSEECAGGGNCDAAASTGAPAVPVGAGLNRVASLEVALASDSPGVIPGTGPGADDNGSGGGCTVGHGGTHDAGLILLLGVALAGLALRRRRVGPTER